LLTGALLPLGIVGLLTVAMPSSGVGSADPTQQVITETRNQLDRTATAQANRIAARLSTVGSSVVLLAEYAGVVLAAPEIFTEQMVPDLAAQAKAAEDQSAATSSSESSVPAPLDNPLFYSDSDDGAIRKLIDDGRPAVYFAKPGSGKFSSFDLHRLHALAAVDPLLMQPATNPLCTQMFIITRDNLLRTYPFRDFSLWPPDKDLGKPRNYWSADKADDQGLVWTSPYFSAFTGSWVVACMAAVNTGERMVAVAGCEIDLSTLSDELLTFSLSQGGACWLVKPLPLEDDNPARWLLLASQSGSRDDLGAIPISAADVPDEKHTGTHILAEADILSHARPEFLQRLKQLLDVNAATPAQVLPDTEIGITDGNYLATAPIQGTGWVLGGDASSGAIPAVESFVKEVGNSTRHRLVVLLAAVFCGVLLAFILAWFEARRISQPLMILGQQIKQAALTKRTSSVAIADEGEIGVLAKSVQELIDATTKRRNGNSNSHSNVDLDVDSAQDDDADVAG